MNFKLYMAMWTSLMALILWLLAWFISLEPNLFEWEPMGRFFFVTFSLIFGAVIAGVIEANEPFEVEYDEENDNIQ